MFWVVIAIIVIIGVTASFNRDFNGQEKIDNFQQKLKDNLENEDKDK